MTALSTHTGALPGALGRLRCAWLACLTLVVVALGHAGSAPPCLAGTLVDARCPCGYQKTGMALFGGKANFRTVCMFPALCRPTGDMVLVNLLAPQATAGCQTGAATPYNAPSLAPKTPGKPVATWNAPGNVSATLYDGGYFCPRCKRHTLRFSASGAWD